MRGLVGLFIGMSLYGADLIQIANEASMQQLEHLNQKYQQPLLVDGSKVYLIPTACRLDRYYGGSSQGVLELVQAPNQTEKILMTQEVFEANETTQIMKKIEQEKSIAIAEAKISRAFLEDKEGRGFGGASQVPLDFSFEKVQVLLEGASASDKVASSKEVVVVTSVPQCDILNDGSGYHIDSLNSPQLYRNGVLAPVIDNLVRYE